jgi:hypothetical protein
MALAGIAFFIYRDRQEDARRWQRQQAEQAAQVAARQPIFARGDFAPILELCQDGWRDDFHVYRPPAALAWTRSGLDGYFLEGTDSGTWRQLRCSACGVQRGPRVVRPLLELLPAEASPALNSAAEDRWKLALATLSRAPLGPADLAVELLPNPLTGAVLTRRWRGLEGGARPTTEPADAPPFPGLIAAPEFALAPGAAPPALRSPPRYRWGEQADAAFAVIAKALPTGAGVVEITLDEDEIELTIEWPTPAFDGNPPAPYGDMDFDEYGVAQSDWWYPGTIPGFGCSTGRPVAELRAEYAAARARLAGGKSTRAWYSCSTAYSDGRHGAWHLFTE